MSLDRKTLKVYMHHLQDETDAAYLYRVLASAEKDAKSRDVYQRLAEVEDRHTSMWRDLLTDQGHEIAPLKASVRARVLAWIARRFGASSLFGLLLWEEGQEVKSYIDLHRRSELKQTKQTALTLAKESAEHAESLSRLVGGRGEPWHNSKTGGFLGNVIYGFNDGLTANLGLLAGVFGASADAHIVLVSGVAGMIADSLSMGASGYLAAKSEREVHANTIAMEREEILLMPELEQQELALIYEAKGVERDRAQQMARGVMQDPQRALEEQIRDELGIHEAHTTPLREGWITGVATAAGALIPVAPFFPIFFLGEGAALWTAFILAMLCHFGVGAARSFFTGRSVLRSGMDMFAVGLGVALVGYFVGDLITKWI